MWQHRNNTVCQIYTCSTVQRFSVKSTIFLHIIRHISNMNAKNIIFTISHNRHGIIKIFRILAINRNHLPVTDVFSSLHVCLTDRFRYTLCLIQHLLWKFYRKIISFYNRHNICSRIIDMTDDFYNLSLRTSAFLAVRSQLDYNFMPVYSFF